MIANNETATRPMVQAADFVRIILRGAFRHPASPLMAIRNISLVRKLKGSPSTASVAAVDAKDTIHVWNVDTFTKVDEVPTFSKTPNVRVSLNRDASAVYAGSWYAGGAMAYSLSESRELWRRKDLRRFSDLSAEGHASDLYCWFEGKATLRLDPSTGQTVETLRGVREVFASPAEDMFLFARQELHFGPALHVTRFKVARTTFAVLDVAFAHDYVAVTESTGPVRCFSLETGTEAWWHKAASGGHFIWLSFCASMGCFAGVQPTNEKSRTLRLVHLDKISGASRVVSELAPALDFAFCRSGSLLVSSEGDVIEVASGRVLRRLEFPREEYEEPEFPSWEQRIRSGTPEQRELARLLGPP